MPRTAARLTFVVMLAALTAVLSGCARVEHPAVADYRGWPSDAPAASLELIDGNPHAMWTDGGRRIAIVMFGSSSCPPIGASLDVLAPAGQGNHVRVNVAEQPRDRACTADFGPHTTEFATPRSVTTDETLSVEVEGVTISVPPPARAN